MYGIDFDATGLDEFQEKTIRAMIGLSVMGWLVTARPKPQEELPRVLYEKAAELLNGIWPDLQFRVFDD